MSRVPDEPSSPYTRRPHRRKVVSAEKLLQKLNERLESYGHCHSCRFVGPIRPLQDPEDDGRNWSRFVALVCSSAVGSGCARIAERILDDASAEFNLNEIG